jgi:hypothetical protein
MRIVMVLWIVMSMATGSALAQGGNTGAGLAGVGAGTALGAAASGGATPSSATGGNAPIEIQILSLHGLHKIAADVAKVVGTNKSVVCRGQSTCSILLEDSTSSSQIALYRSAQSYIDALKTVHTNLQSYFALSFTTLPQPFSAQVGTTQSMPVTIKNLAISSQTIEKQNIAISGPNKESFDAKPDSSCENLARDASCTITLSFTAPKSSNSQNAILQISYFSSASKTMETISFPLTGIITQPPPSQSQNQTTPLSPQDQNLDLKKFMKDKGIDAGSVTSEKLQALGDRAYFDLKGSSANLAIPFIAPLAGPAAAASGTPTTGSPAPPATPYSLQWTNGLSSDLSALKSAYTYAPSSLQITTQAFEVLVESELLKSGIDVKSYLSTSALNLKPATDTMSKDFGSMLTYGADVTLWTTQCGKPPVANASQGATPQSSTPQATSASYSVCNQAGVTSELAIAQQLASGFTTLLTSPSDGNGNPVIVDILRGYELSSLTGSETIPSLQLAVLAAGGSSRTNNIFGLTLFYQFAPSYNAGVIATFELRDGANQLVQSGARNVLYGYKKWNPGHINKNDIKQVDENIADDCTFCSSKKP